MTSALGTLRIGVKADPIPPFVVLGRLDHVIRALTKIVEGIYGESEVSGRPTSDSKHSRGNLYARGGNSWG